MNSRTPTKIESLYIEAVMRQGCVACRKMGYDIDVPPEYLEFHHNAKIGSRIPLCHLFGVALCPVHHRGAAQGKIPKSEPIRHVNIKNDVLFSEVVGSDLKMAEEAWERLPLEVIDAIGDKTGLWNFTDLVNKVEQGL